MAFVHQQTTGTASIAAGGAELGDYTTTRRSLLRPAVRLTGLEAIAGVTITLKLILYDTNGTTKLGEGLSISVSKPTADTVIARNISGSSGMYSDTAGQIVKLSVTSSNANDTSIGWTIAWLDDEGVETAGLMAARGDRLYDKIWYVSKEGSGSNDGKTPHSAFLAISSAVAVATAGDLISVGPGTYTINNLGDQIELPNNVDMIGSGRNNTILSSLGVLLTTVGGGCIVKPGTNSLIQGFTIKGTASASYQACVGAYNDNSVVTQAAFQNAIVRDCWLDCDTDGVYMGGGQLSASDLTLEDCLITTKWHAAVCFNNTTEQMTLRMRRCVIEAIGPSGLGASQTDAAAIACKLKAAVYLHNCLLRAANGPAAGQTAALRTFTDSEVSGYPFIYLDNCALDSKSATGSVYSIYDVLTNTRIVDNNSSYDPTNYSITGTLVRHPGESFFGATTVEPTAPPSATGTMKARLNWLATLGRNKVTQTNTTQIVKADDGTTTIGTSTVSDDGTTFTRGEFS